MNDGSADSLSDVLREMASGRASEEAEQSHPESPDEDDEQDTDDDPDAVPAAVPREQTKSAHVRRGAGSGRGGTRPPARPHSELKAFAVPVLFTVGTLLLIPAIWAVLYLLGAPVWAHDRPDAGTMAAAMLVCWPIAGALLAGGFIYGRQLWRRRRR